MLIHRKLLELIDSRQENPVYIHIATTILQHARQMQQLNIQDFAERCYTSPSTISRFVHHLGCNSFASFKLELQDSLKNYESYMRPMPATPGPDALSSCAPLYASELESLLQHVQRSVQPALLEEIAGVMHESACVNFYPLATLPAVSALQADLWQTGVASHILLDEARQFESGSALGPGDFAFLILPDRAEASQLTRLAQLIHDRGAKVLAICSSPKPLVSRFLDYALSFVGTNTAIDQYGFQYFVSLLNIFYRAKYL